MSWSPFWACRELTHYVFPSNLPGPHLEINHEVVIESNWGQITDKSVQKDQWRITDLNDHTSFDEMGLKENLLRGVYAYG